MPLLSFKRRTCILTLIKPRTENSGSDEKTPACDITLADVPFDREDIDKLCGPYYSRSLYDEQGKGEQKKIIPTLTRFKGAFELDDVFYKSRRGVATGPG